MTVLKQDKKNFVSTRNACKVCSPLGASVAFKGIRKCVPLIHGSQGCSTYIRRYLISHYKEPVDIASSNFSADTPIYGGYQNFERALDNITSQFNPDAIAICTTCLSETIGEDISMFISEYKEARKDKKIPELIEASTPSYQGTHMDGFHEAVTSIVKYMGSKGPTIDQVNILPGFVSPADIRYLKEIFDDFGIQTLMLPDYSDTLDNPNWHEYIHLPNGGTPIEELKTCGQSKATFEFGEILNKGKIYGAVKNTKLNPTAGEYMENNFDVPLIRQPLPFGVTLTDRLFNSISGFSGKAMPEKHKMERGRLIDLYADGHKYVFGKKAILYGEEDFVLSMAYFLKEIGMIPSLVATGGSSTELSHRITSLFEGEEVQVHENVDFEKIKELTHGIVPDIIIGNSKGYYIAREMQIPIVRVGFPIHDRIGGQNIKHVGYRGASEMFTTIVNTLLTYRQDNSPVGYKYM